MEEQTVTASTPPPANRRDTQSARPPLTRPATPPAVLSNSEPFLRFPRPQGNRRLANWISTSDPDIMRTVTTEHSGLAESAYELVTGTDSESQDGHYTESMSESVDSLDLHYDGSSGADDDAETLPQTSTLDRGNKAGDDANEAANDEAHDDASLVNSGGSDSEEEACSRCSLQYTQSEDANEAGNDEADDDASLVNSDGCSDSEEEACSRCSLQYTQNSLKTPSILTPEASRLVERPFDLEPLEQLQPPEQLQGQKPESFRLWFDKKWADLYEFGALAKDFVVDTASAALPGLLFTAAFALLLEVLYTVPPAEKFGPHSSGVASTITATTTVTISTTKVSTSAGPGPPVVGGMGLIPLSHDASDEWLFGAKKPVVSFTPHAQTDILVHVPSHVKQNWLAKNCLVVTATRDDRQIETFMSPVDEGILLSFPKKETHGVVDLSLKATCRPKVRRLVKVHFGKGIMEEAYEMTKNLAHDLSGLVPAAAQEAERCLEGARRSLGAVSDTVGNSVVFVSDNLLNRLGNVLAGAQQSFGGAKSDALSRIKGATEDISRSLGTVSQQAREQLHRVRSLRDRLRLGLLDAQISANMWWLKATGRKTEHDDYHRKAIIFLAKLDAAAREASRDGRLREKAGAAARAWKKMTRSGRCQRWAERGGRSKHECQAEA